MKKTSITLLLIILLVLSGCSQPSITATPTGEYITQSTAVTLTLANTNTMMPTNTSEPTAVLTNTPTLTPVPTLTHREAREKLVELLADNGGCRLPCFLGITPGMSGSQNAIEVYGQFNSLSDLYDSTRNSGVWYFSINMSTPKLVSFYIQFLASDNIVNLVEFDANARTELPDGLDYDYDSADYGNLMNYYMLPSILAEYGPPDEIYLTPVILEGTNDYENGTFRLMLLFAQQGFAVHYLTRLQVQGDQLLGCMQYGPVEFEIHPSGDADSFYENLTPKWTKRMEQYLPLEDSTEMTIQSFYETFRNPTDQCIETPLDFWYGDNP